MSESVLVRFARAIRYPEEVPAGATAYSFVVDDGRIEAEATAGRLVLTRELAAAEDTDLALFAGYAAGRVRKEDAVLAYDPGGDRLILWQELSAKADEALLLRFFEVFASSCDWWLARVKGAETSASIPEMVIRP